TMARHSAIVDRKSFALGGRCDGGTGVGVRGSEDSGEVGTRRYSSARFGWDRCAGGGVSPDGDDVELDSSGARTGDSCVGDRAGRGDEGIRTREQRTKGMAAKFSDRIGIRARADVVGGRGIDDSKLRGPAVGGSGIQSGSRSLARRLGSGLERSGSASSDNFLS